jgi:hypothetical protein
LNSIPGLNYGAQDEKHLDAIAVLSLPSHLRKTALAIIKITVGDKEAVSSITGQDETNEAKNLVELASMGYLRRKQQSKKTVYELK